MNQVPKQSASTTDERDTMPRVLTTAAMLIGFALGDVLPALLPVPRWIYDPHAGRLFVGSATRPEEIGYFGQLVWAAAGALVGAGLGRILGALLLRRSVATQTEAIDLATAWALTALAGVGAYLTWLNWP